jgi:chromosome segregation ATPase
MSAVLLQESDATESEPVSPNERDDQATQVAELRADVRHIQSDTTDIKADLRITNQRIDALSERVDQRFESFGQMVDQRFESFGQKVDQRFEKVDQRFEKVDQRFEQVDQRLNELKDSLASAKVWALGLYIALSGSLLYALARGFKWL